ncbi:MAG: efflux RND transporter periplasmic adaptor subunit [Planctomycetaceae bacterium]|nr:efflux RND transporter periplasmic adaptor subunit [Planctomycetaceae bacterium]
MNNTGPTENRAANFISRHRGKLFAGQAVLFLLAGMLIAGAFSRSTGGKFPDSPAASVTVPAGETLWTCSMHPQIRQPKPGKCPICGMDLIPITKTAGGMRTVAMSAESRALMQIATTPVERRYVTHEIPMVGRVDYDETRLGYITAWVPGRLDRLFVDYTGLEVKQGDHLVSIYSEQLYSAQEELIQALKNQSDRPSTTTTLIRPIDLVESAREKLRLLGLKDEQITKIEQSNAPEEHLIIYAPLGGVVIEKLKQAGERVQLGERIYTIADLNQVWVHLDVYESDLQWVRYGQDVVITTDAYPGDEFRGRIAFIQPVLNDKTRTVKVRVNVPNLDGRLKPEMFVHAVVRPQVAAGGKVMDPSLVGKWLSPMHPEIVRDEPGDCPICGMPLVRAETLGFVTPISDGQRPPLVVPYSAALVTGNRAIVYVQLPNMPSFAEPAFQTLSTVVQGGDMQKIRGAFITYANMLDRPQDQPGTDYAHRVWNQYADNLSQQALAGQRVKSAKGAEPIIVEIEAVMSAAREQFAPAERPTFEGREIVLGPRAGDYYLVRNGLFEGEMVVTQGNFKIDAEIQIQAKPSMMTPEGGGGGGHNHGGTAAKKKNDEHAGHVAALPATFTQQLRTLDEAFDQVFNAIQQQDLTKVTAMFRQFAQSLGAVDGSTLSGHPRMVWKEFAMLLGNDAVEGADVQQMANADRVFLLLKGHMRRMREQLGVRNQESSQIERLAVSPGFQSELNQVWQQYLLVGQALAGDNLSDATNAVATLQTSLSGVSGEGLDERSEKEWSTEYANLIKLVERLKAAKDLQTLRSAFWPLSQEIGLLARVFGFGNDSPIYELHCPMAFQGKGAVWYQPDDQVRNPYFGSTMLKCADRVEELSVESGESRAPHTRH